MVWSGGGRYEADWDTTTMASGTHDLMLAASHEELAFQHLCPPFGDNKLIPATDYLELKVRNGTVKQ